MIFAELQYKEHYDGIHKELVKFVESRFSNVKSGHQGDSWIWILGDGDKVQIDTFTSMHHQIKSPYPESSLVQDVIRELKNKYSLYVYSEPEPEAHEG